MASVDTKTPAINRMSEDWRVIEPVINGTAAMRKAQKQFLPKQPREDDEDYKYRLETATLFPAFARTCAVMAGKPFSKELTPSDTVPASIAALLSDIDGEGRSLHAFAADLFFEAVSYGFGGVLVDHTPVDQSVHSIADEKRIGARPYWRHYKHDSILGYRLRDVDGVVQLAQLRLLEASEEPDGEWGVKTVLRVRVLEPGIQKVYVQQDGSFVLESESVISVGGKAATYIPFVPIYGRRVAMMNGAPPLLELAHQNIKHWQQQSDQSESVRFCSKRSLVFIGLQDKDDLTISSSSAIILPPGADAKILQGSAESVTVGRSELDALEAQMIQTGAELLVSQPGQRTATEASNDAEANKSELQRIVEGFEDSLDLALQYTANWLGEKDGGSVSLFKDFGAASLSDATAQLIPALHHSGLITKVTAVRELQRRGVIGPDVDPEQEIESVTAEGPQLGLIE